MKLTYVYQALLALALCPIINAAPVRTINNTQGFNGLIHSNNYVVAEFFNPRCSHCINFKKAGTFAALAQKNPHVTFVEVSSVEGKDLHRKYNIQWTPSFVYFVNGKEVARPKMFGKEMLQGLINEYFSR